MAKENSFDIVSECDMQEVDNAYQQSCKALQQRYDLKDSGSSIELDKSDRTFTVLAPSEFVSNQVIDILNTHLVRRKIDLKAVTWGSPQDASGGQVRTVGTIVQGIDQDISRQINKDIKAEKFKVKVQIEGDKLRVSGPKRDTLQDVIAFLKDKDYGIPLQFTNYR
ncbi:MAG: YajQ family cyclic di-GMP-binding protein [Coriobacteriaceae bacterium]|nr:YajQ family cyclic di-GMP-binding protein [Coriobacteriaceae bacterium]